MEKNFDIIFLKPKKYEECKECVEYIKDEKIVHINLRDLDDDNSQRVLDFISGAVYIQEAQIVNPGEKIYCTIPKNKKHEIAYKDSTSRVLDSRYDDEEEEIVRAK